MPPPRAKRKKGQRKPPNQQRETQPSPPPPGGEPNQPGEGSSRRNLLLAAGGAAVSAVIGAVVAEVANRATSSQQAVRDDRAVEEAKRTSARQKAPFSANAYYYNRSDDPVFWALPTSLTGDQQRQLMTRQSSYRGELPDSFEDVVHGVAEIVSEPHRLFTRIRISMVGKWTGPVFVRQIRAKVLRRSPPLSGAFLFRGSQGEGKPLEIGFNLDEPDSVARLLESDGQALGAAYMDRHSLNLSPNEPLTIDVQAYTDRWYCEWVIELDLDLDGERRTQVVDDHGRPFRSTGLARHYQDRYYVHINNGWTPEGAGPPSFKV
ncbi:hypothetical protein ACIBCR_02835 [Micromonospora echinospora]|uniref:hypothetical protein n=1 Tax=Micromonospora echinospora TaxID=1877 RepID=UPI0037A942D5